MADERELQEQDLGVGEGDSTESAQPTAQPEPTRQPEPERKVNLDELPEFRKFRSEYDRKLAETERRYQDMLARQAAELKAKKMAEMDDYQKLQYELDEVRQREQMAYQQLEEVRVERAKREALQEVSDETGVSVNELMDADNIADAWRMANRLAKQQAQQRETERQAEEKRRVAERAVKVETNRVDLGSGTPIPTNDWERGYAEAKAKKSSRALFTHALSKQQE